MASVQQAPAVTKPVIPYAKVSSGLKFVTVDLTPAQRQAWDETKTALIWQAPGFAHILYSLLNLKKDDGILFWCKTIPTMCTDGRAIAANPDFFFALPLPNRVFAVCHEIAHAMFNHCEVGYQLQRAKVISVYQDGKWLKLPYIHMTANKAMDYVINDLLTASNIGKCHKNWLHDTKIGTHANTWVEVYGKLYSPPPDEPEPDDGDDGDESDTGDEQGEGDKPGEGDGDDGQDPTDQPGKGKSKGKGKPGKQPATEGNQGGNTGEPAAEPKDPGQFDEHLAPGTIEGKDPEECKTNEQQWQQAIASAMEIARAQGKLPGAMEQFFKNFLEPKVDWTDEVRGELARKVGSGGYDYRRAHRRLIVRDIYAPSQSGHGCGIIVVFIDTSGSVFAVEHLLDRWFAEMSGILSDLKPRQIIVIQADDGVQAVDEIDDEMDLVGFRAKPSKGGGGTSFKPSFQYLEDNNIVPDAAIYLTDMWGDFPDEAPDYEVIWGSITPKDNHEDPGFGKVIYIPTDGTA